MDVLRSRSTVNEPNNRQCRMLRARDERPRGCRPTDHQCDELAPPHCPPGAQDQGIVTTQARAGKDPAHVRCGSKADIRAAKSDVRFTPESGLWSTRVALWTRCGHQPIKPLSNFCYCHPALCEELSSLRVALYPFCLCISIDTAEKS